VTALETERAFLAELGAGCSIPAGAFARVEDGVIYVHGVMIGVDGTESVRCSLTGGPASQLGRELAMTLRDEMGGASLPGWDRSEP
jgi:hydroxymethylbilane synthase